MTIRTLTEPASIERHERLQSWSVELLARRAGQLLGLRFEIDHQSTYALESGPLIVLCRHVSIIDSSLPGLSCQRLAYRVRGVLMAELLADPGFDLLYQRTGSVFIDRAEGPGRAVGSVALRKSPFATNHARRP